MPNLRNILIALLGVVPAACSLPATPFTPAPPTPTVAVATPTPIDLAETFESVAGGFSVQYPQGWATRELSGTLRLAPSAAALESEATGAELVIQIDATPLSAVIAQHGPSAGANVATFFEISSAGPLEAGYTIGATETIRIDGVAGLAADLDAPGGAGRMIVLLAPSQAVRVLGQAEPAAWQAQRPLFEAITASMRLFEPTPVATPTPLDQAVQPPIVTTGPPGFVLRLGGDRGPRGGRFTSARGLAAAPDGTIYLAESSQGVWVFAPGGALQMAFGKDDLLDAYDVARGPDGDLFVADYGRNAIVRFTPDGDLVRSWGSTGDAPEQFGLSSPQRIAVGADGSVYAIDSRIDAADNRVVSSIVRFDGADGSFIERIELPPAAAPNDLAVDTRGNIYLAETFGGAVVKLDPAGEEIARLSDPAAAEGIAAGAIDLDARGNIYVATWNEGVLKFSPSGLLLASGGTIAAPGVTPQPGEFSLPNGIVAAPGNVAWVSDNSGEYSAITALRLVGDADALATAEATPPPEEALVRQWAAAVEASSAYDDSYGPDGATGPPDVEGCRDSADAWASADPNGLETLELTFETPVFAMGVNIHQNHRPGFISRVEVIDEDGQATRVYIGRPALSATCPDVLEITFGPTLRRIVGVRLTIDQRSGANWNEIDAVELLGIP